MGNVNAPVNSKFILNKKNFHKSELEVLQFSGLSKEWFKCIDVPVDEFEGETVSIRTIIVSERNLRLKPYSECTINGQEKETLVIVHGYAGGSALFFPILKRLAVWFDIILCDIIG